MTERALPQSFAGEPPIPQVEPHSYIAGLLTDQPSKRDVQVRFRDHVGLHHRVVVAEAVARINFLRAMRRGWDGASADIISDVATASSVYLLNCLSVEGALRPQVFPLFSGGLQLEWEAFSNRVEVEVEADGSVYLVAVDDAGNSLFEEEAANVYMMRHVDDLAMFLSGLSERLG